MPISEKQGEYVRVVVLGLLGFTIIFFLCVWMYAGRMESALSARVADTLTSSGYRIAGVDADGRTITLRGLIEEGTDRADVVAVARTVPGVRGVIDLLEIDAPNVAVAEPPSAEQVESAAESQAQSVAATQTKSESGAEKVSSHLRFSKVEGKIIISGALPTQESLDEVTDAIADAYENVEPEYDLTVDDALSEPEWLAGFVSLVPELGKLALFDSVVSDGEFLVTGVARSKEDRETFLSKALNALGDLVDVDSEIRVDGASQGSFYRPERAPAVARLAPRLGERLRPGPLDYDVRPLLQTRGVT